MSVEILHHGAVQGVTGSCHELVVGERSLLIDCGLFQGDDEGRAADAGNLEIDFPLDRVQALVITHVHIDHCGRIPYLLAAGFDGPIYCSIPSARMLPAILEDALKIGFTRNRDLIERVLDRIRGLLVPVPYDTWHNVWEDSESSLGFRLQRAGHILGSAYVECDVGCDASRAEGGDQPRGQASGQRFVFSGDLGAPESPLLPEPAPPERADILVIESTYGDKDHEDRHTRRQRLQAVLENALADGGTVLVPTFAIGRTQELLYEIESIMHEAGDSTVADTRWADLDIVVDSPLAANFTAIYRELKPFWDDEAMARVRSGRHPLSFDQLTVVDSHEQHQQMVRLLAKTGRPAIVLAGSGMCTGGRVVNYLQALLEDARNDVLFVGYQAQGTLGRELLAWAGHPEKQGSVRIDDRDVVVNARIHRIGGYSAHAGQSDLVRFVEGIPERPREIRIVHGDPGAKEALRRKLGPGAVVPEFQSPRKV